MKINNIYYFITTNIIFLIMDTTTSLQTEIKNLIDNNKYVKSCISNKKKDFHSLSYLVDKELSQSDCIKLGTGVEKMLKDIILYKNPSFEDIRPPTQKGKKEKDHLFKDEETKTIYYAELKSNLHLDTEKCKSTCDKCVKLLEDIKQEYPDYTIYMYLVGVRYYEKKSITSKINNKYNTIKDNLLGVKEYLQIMNINTDDYTEIKYKEIINYLANKMFQPPPTATTTTIATEETPPTTTTQSPTPLNNSL